MKVQYVENGAVSAHELALLRKSVSWNGMESVCKELYKGKNYHIACYDDKKLVGYLDTLSNGIDAYLQDLIVNPAYQGQGIGTELVSRALAYLKAQKVYMISVFYGDGGSGDLAAFYARFGFSPMFGGQMQNYEVE